MEIQKFGVVFPGQGSQAIGMLAHLAQSDHIVQETFAEASTKLGYDLWQLVQHGPKEKLDQTEYTQPALLAAEVAIWRCWKDRYHFRPSLLAGHSLGEYSALVCAEALAFADAIELVALRGKWMQEAVPPGKGAMAAILGLEDQEVVQLCQETVQPNEILTPANFNSIGQVIISGDTSAVERAITKALEKGAKLAKKIAVSVPSHSPLMQSAAVKMAEKIQHVAIVSPKIPIVHNYDVKTHSDAKSIREALVLQLTHPVRWVETVHQIIQHGIHCLFECGPGRVLAGLNKRISKDIETYPLDEPNYLDGVLQRLRECLETAGH